MKEISSGATEQNPSSPIEANHDKHLGVGGHRYLEKRHRIHTESINQEKKNKLKEEEEEEEETRKRKRARRRKRRLEEEGRKGLERWQTEQRESDSGRDRSQREQRV